MRNLINRSPQSIVTIMGEKDYREFSGFFASPRSRQYIEAAVRYGAPWAADNDCYGYWARGELYNPRPLLKALEAWKPWRDACLFINAPDVLTNAEATLNMFWYWREIIHGFGFPVAFTVQDGVEQVGIPPWGAFEALFIGATNATKYSPYVYNLVQEARSRGKWVHNGRVNTTSKVKLTGKMGCHSFDGTGYTHWPGEKVLRDLRYQIAAHLQRRLI